MTINTTLSEQYLQLRKEQPRLRLRDAAAAMGVSELELLELGLQKNTVRLGGDFKAMLAEVKQLGHVMALTRNEYAVHERKGVYDNISFMAGGSMGVAVNEDIDLRFFMSQWQHAYAVKTEAGNDRILHSLQFFNSRGAAVHKIFLTPKSEPAGFNSLVSKYRSEDQQTATVVDGRPAEKAAPLPDHAIDVAAFQQAWLGLQDTHDFFGLLKQYQVARAQAMRLAPEGYARRLGAGAVSQLLHLAAERQVPIMVFVGNDGCIQIHTGPVERILPMEGWINVMDPEFNLHLKTEGIAEVWETRKPTRDGVVTAVEVFDPSGELMVYFFGKRKPGIPEMETWRDLTAGLR